MNADVSWISRYPAEKEVLFCSWHQQLQRWQCVLRRIDKTKTTVNQFVELDVVPPSEDPQEQKLSDESELTSVLALGDYESTNKFLERVLKNFDPATETLSPFDQALCWQYRNSLQYYDGFLVKVLKTFSWRLEQISKSETFNQCRELILQWRHKDDLLEISTDTSFEDTNLMKWCRERLVEIEANEKKQQIDEVLLVFPLLFLDFLAKTMEMTNVERSRHTNLVYPFQDGYLTRRPPTFVEEPTFH